MNTLNVILIILTAVAAFLYLKTKLSEQKLKSDQESIKNKLSEYLPSEGLEPITLSGLIDSIQGVITNGNAQNEKLSKLLAEEKEIVRKRETSISDGIKAYDRLFDEKEKEIAEKDNLIKKLNDQLGEFENKVTARAEIDGEQMIFMNDNGPRQDTESFLREFEDFVQSADISMTEIRLNAKDLIREEYINVIKGLHKIGLFPANLQQDFQFDPKSLAVKFQMIVNDDPMYFKSWNDLVYERDMFIKTIDIYVESVINQRKINQAVDEALKGKEATNV